MTCKGVLEEAFCSSNRFDISFFHAFSELFSVPSSFFSMDTHCTLPDGINNNDRSTGVIQGDLNQTSLLTAFLGVWRTAISENKMTDA